MLGPSESCGRSEYQMIYRGGSCSKVVLHRLENWIPIFSQISILFRFFLTAVRPFGKSEIEVACIGFSPIRPLTEIVEHSSNRPTIVESTVLVRSFH